MRHVTWVWSGCLLALVAAGCGGGGGGGREPTPPSSNADLSALSVSSGLLVPAFEPVTTAYTVGAALAPPSVTVTPTAADEGATIEVQGVVVASGTASAPIDLGMGTSAVSLVVTAEDGTTEKTYAVVFDRAYTGQAAYVKASNTGADDRFGRAVALSGDTLVVGAPYEASSATGVDGDQADDDRPKSGAAYVFVRDGVTWVQQAYLKASNTDAYDEFGYSVALSGDTLVVGARAESSTATGVDGNQADDTASVSGAAYVFR